jgi:hypothetical protein
MPIINEFANEIGFDFDQDTGIVSNGQTIILIIPNSTYFSQYRFLARDFYRAAQGGYTALVFFMDELLTNRDLIKSMIIAKAGMPGLVKIAARRCDVVTLTAKSAAEFFKYNHISGHTAGQLYLGLQHADQIVAAISMRQPFTKKYLETIEIARFAVLRGHSVMGGFSKLLAAVKAELSGRYRKILSYSDLRYGTGNVYVVSGFSEVGHTKPDYYYTDGISRYHRFKYRASGEKSEREIALQAGVYRMYGVGSKIYELDIA